MCSRLLCSLQTVTLNFGCLHPLHKPNPNVRETTKLAIGIPQWYFFQLSLSGTVFEQVKSMCDLGVLIQSTLMFTLQM